MTVDGSYCFNKKIFLKIYFYCDLLTVSKYVFHLTQLILVFNNI